MTPEERSEGLAAAARTQRAEMIALADRVLEDCTCEVLQPPAAGTVMLEFESEIGAFCFSEVIVTTASVRVAHVAGWGCVLGFDREAALATAVLDAEAARGSESTAQVMRLATESLASERRERERRARAVVRTKV